MHATHDGGIVCVGAVTMQFFEIGKNAFDVVQGVGTHRMARHLCDLPGAEIAEYGLGERAALALQLADFFAEIDFAVIADIAQFFDLGLQFGDGLFEIQKMMLHNAKEFLSKFDPHAIYHALAGAHRARLCLSLQLEPISSSHTIGCVAHSNAAGLG